jgi:hypothetical protein
MDWQRIWTVLDVFLKAQNVPHTDRIRQRALEELKAWNSDQPMEEVVEEPELNLEESTEGVRRV